MSLKNKKKYLSHSKTAVNNDCNYIKKIFTFFAFTKPSLSFFIVCFYILINFNLTILVTFALIVVFKN